MPRVPQPDQVLPFCELQFSASSGPGGQHVNKVATRATLLFDFEACPAISAEAARLIRARLRTRLSADGRLRVVSQSGRSQRGNRQRAEERLIELLAAALKTEKPRKATRPTKASQRRRVDEKKRRGEVKKLRTRRIKLDE